MAQITAADFNLKEQMETMAAAIDRIAAALEKTNASIIDSQEESNKNINDSKKKTAKDINKANRDAVEEENKSRKQTADTINAETKSTVQQVGENLISMARKATGNLLSEYERLMKNYTETQQKLTFGLIDSSVSYDSIKNALSVLSTNTFIKQNEVYNNLNKLVSQGITLNVAQRAFLQTTAEQVGIDIDLQNEKFNNLIDLYRADLSEARLAQMAGLKTFLEQNYDNSQYIKQGFSQVSDALFEMQSLVSAQVAMSTEKTIQTYLGSFASSGGYTNTATNIADALGKIGSGDFSGLNEGMQNLMIMAASRAGLSYADLLTGGLDQEKSEQLMTSLFSYISGMADIGGGSNIAMNAIAKIFGVSVSDIKAAQNMELEAIRVNDVNSSISQFFTNVMKSTGDSIQQDLFLSNLVSGAALNTNYANYRLTNTIMSGVANLLKDTDVNLLGVDVSGLFGAITELKPTINMLTAMAGQMGEGAGSAADAVSNAFKSLFSFKTLKALNPFDKSVNFGDIANDIVSAILQGIGGSLEDAFDLVGGLAGGPHLDTRGSIYEIIGGPSGSFTGTTGGEPGQYNPNNEITIEGSEDDFEKAHTLDDLYNLLADDFPTTTFTTATRLVEAGNEVLIGDAKTTQYITDMITLTAVSTENILMLLENVFAGGTRQLIDIGSLGLENTWGDWSGTSRP